MSGREESSRSMFQPLERGQAFPTSGTGKNDAIKIKLNGENRKYTSKAIHMDFNGARYCGSLHKARAVQGEVMDELIQKCHLQPCYS